MQWDLEADEGADATYAFVGAAAQAARGAPQDQRVQSSYVG